MIQVKYRPFNTELDLISARQKLCQPFFQALFSLPDTFHKKESINAYYLLSLLYEQMFSSALPEITRAEHGKPIFKETVGLHFSVSHAKGYVAAALAPYPVGVDIESPRKFKNLLATRVLSPEEQGVFERFPDKDQAFTKLWTVKESISKADGRGLSIGFSKINTLSIDSGELYFDGNRYQISTHELPSKYFVTCSVLLEPASSFHKISILPLLEY